MEIKKSPEADLENKKLSFLLIGLVIMLSVVYITLEWTKTEVVKYDEVASLIDEEIEDLMPVTIQDQTPPPPPPEAVAPPPVVTEIQIVDNTQEVGDVQLQSTESDENVEIAVQAPVVVQVEEEVIDEVISFAKIEEKPTFPGGDSEMMKYLATSIKYPAKAAEMGIEGTVVIQFVIGKDGKVTDAKVVRGKDPLLDKEALRVVNAMPAWKPGKQGGKAVRVAYTLPVRFKLQ
ncbi:MAG: energy transducer TonB [Paludibacteraceae bacterium]|nr:energy transducer TonB [Paludibacteraceae bacterium]